MQNKQLRQLMTCLAKYFSGGRVTFAKKTPAILSEQKKICTVLFPQDYMHLLCFCVFVRITGICRVLQTAQSAYLLAMLPIEL